MQKERFISLNNPPYTSCYTLVAFWRHITASPSPQSLRGPRFIGGRSNSGRVAEIAAALRASQRQWGLARNDK
ncbi:MAG: hypothetical protein RI591_05990 [Dehalococcoidia bacterium]|nr:hypothetical protein [Dehalococcoidia bacterium]